MSGLFIALILILVELVMVLVFGLLFHDRLRPIVRSLTGWGPASSTPREFADHLAGANKRLRMIKGKMMLESADEKRLAACDEVSQALREASKEFARHPLASAEYGHAMLHSCERLIELLENHVTVAEALAIDQRNMLAREYGDLQNVPTRIAPFGSAEAETTDVNASATPAITTDIDSSTAPAIGEDTTEVESQNDAEDKDSGSF